MVPAFLAFNRFCFSANEIYRTSLRNGIMPSDTGCDDFIWQSRQFHSRTGYSQNPVSKGSYFAWTTFCGLPARKERRFSTTTSIRRARAARVAQAICGVMKQFFAVSNGLPV